MPYLGQEPAVGTYELLTLSESFDGSRTAFSILDSLNRAKGISNTNQLIVILNSITQHWGEAFTVSGSTMTFTSAPPSGSTVKILNIARHQVDIGKPSAGTVGTSELSATGTASSSTYLRGDNSWATVSTPITALNNATANELLTVGSTTTELDAESKLTFDGSVLIMKDENDAVTLQADQYKRVAIGTATSNNGRFYVTNTGGIPAMRIDQNTSSQIGLHVRTGSSGLSSLNSGADQLFLEGGSGENCGLTIAQDNNLSGYVVFADAESSFRGAIQYLHSDNTMRFFVDGAETARLIQHSSRGDSLCVGTTNGYAGLDVRSSTAQTAFKLDGRGSPGGEITMYMFCGTDNTGSAGIQLMNNSQQARFVVRHDGDCENTNNSYGSLSDRKLKKDIVDATSQWDDIKAIRMRNFIKIDDVNNVRQLGVVAQELEEAGMAGAVKEIPDYEEVVTETPVLDGNGDPVLDENNNPEVDRHPERTETGTTTKAVKYSVLYMKAIKALQEAMTRIETLETKMATLENK